MNHLFVDLHDRITDMPDNFRGFVTSECKWSIPTYYRKLREPDKCSTAENEMIIKIAQALMVDLRILIKRHRETLKVLKILYKAE